jgi:hypothetical protein
MPLRTGVSIQRPARWAGYQSPAREGDTVRDLHDVVADNITVINVLKERAAASPA